MRTIYLVLFYAGTIFSSPVEKWVDNQIDKLDENPLKIEFVLSVQNEFDVYTTPIEIDILNLNMFQIHLSGKSIYFSENWSKVYDKKTNQVITDYPDTVLLENLRSVLIEKQFSSTIECSKNSPMSCNVSLPEFGVNFVANFKTDAELLANITYQFNKTKSKISHVIITPLIDVDEKFWDPPFKNKFKLDLRN